MVTGIAVRVVLVLALAIAVTSCGGTDTTAVAPTTGTTDTTGRTAFQDPVGDVTGGAGPDLVSIAVSHAPADVTFGIRFAQAPPLRVSRPGGWADMLLVGIDVPPFGPPPTPSGWTGADYVAGLHGFQSVVLFRSMRASSAAAGQPGTTPNGATAAPGGLERLDATEDGATLRFSIPRRMLGDPSSFDFTVATGREGAQVGGGSDFAPGSGTFHYEMPD